MDALAPLLRRRLRAGRSNGSRASPKPLARWSRDLSAAHPLLIAKPSASRLPASRLSSQAFHWNDSGAALLAEGLPPRLLPATAARKLLPAMVPAPLTK